jgi:hypothetical protein
MRETRGIPTALLVLLAAIVAVVLLIHVLHRGSGAPAHYAARPALTPGALNPEVTPATTGSTICSRGWTTTVRPPSSFTSELKLEQMRVYGFAGTAGDYEEDHFISLELGGAPNDPNNLWPERRPQADRVDGVENDLNAQVCSGQLSLADAQRKLAELKWTDG